MGYRRRGKRREDQEGKWGSRVLRLPLCSRHSHSSPTPSAPSSASIAFPSGLASQTRAPQLHEEAGLTSLSLRTVSHEVASVAASVARGAALEAAVPGLSTVARHVALAVTDVTLGEGQVIRRLSVVLRTVSQLVLRRTALVADVAVRGLRVGTLSRQVTHLATLVARLAATIAAHVTVS